MLQHVAEMEVKLHCLVILMWTTVSPYTEINLPHVSYSKNDYFSGNSPNSSIVVEFASMH
jgi:hypothetical protein